MSSLFSPDDEPSDAGAAAKPARKRAARAVTAAKEIPVSAAEFLPQRLSITALRKSAHSCEGCELFRNATQVVFGEGPANANLMIVGETPGDREDLAGKPFVGPAGKLLDDACAEVGIDRAAVYVANAVKHFKWEPRGKRRLHARPSAREISACQPWLAAEIEVVKPRTIICLGATAAQTLLGREFRITRQRGQVIASKWAERMIASWHPSAILRAPDEATRQRMRSELVQDLRLAHESPRTGSHTVAP